MGDYYIPRIEIEGLKFKLHDGNNPITLEKAVRVAKRLEAIDIVFIVYRKNEKGYEEVSLEDLEKKIVQSNKT